MLLFFCARFGNNWKLYYKTRITPGIRDNGTEQRKKIIERLTWKLSISEETVSVKAGPDSEPFLMLYLVAIP